MRLMFARALTVALAVLGGAGAMTFPKLVVAEAVPEAEVPTVAAPSRRHVPVIQVSPAVPSKPILIRREAKPRPATPVSEARLVVRTSVVSQPPQRAALAPAREAPTSPSPPHAAAPTPVPASVPATPTPPPAAPAPVAVSQPAAEPVRALTAADEDAAETATTPKKPKKPKKAKKPKHPQPPPAVAAEPVPLAPPTAAEVAEVEEHGSNGNAYGHDKEQKEKEKDKGKGK